MDEQLNRIESKIEKLDEKLTVHLERIAVNEEYSRTNRGAIAIIFSVIMTILGWIIFKLKFTL